MNIGANLTDPMFRGVYYSKSRHPDDLLDVLLRSQENGVEKIIVTGGSLFDCRECLKLVAKHDWLYTTVGCHPTRCSEFDAAPATAESYRSELAQLIRSHPEKVVAIGEFGLDFDRDNFCPRQTQLKYFEYQFGLVEEFPLPLFLHCRSAAADFCRIIRRNRHLFRSGVVHSFTGTPSEAEEFLDLGLHIGINGCSLKTEENLRALEVIPLDRLLIETDAPWCEVKASHAGHRHIRTSFPSKKKERWEKGQMVKGRNEPACLIHILEILSSVLAVDIVSLAETLYQNTQRIFFS